MRVLKVMDQLLRVKNAVPNLLKYLDSDASFRALAALALSVFISQTQE